jgi:hypothetical protein
VRSTGSRLQLVSAGLKSKTIAAAAVVNVGIVFIGSSSVPEIGARATLGKQQRSARSRYLLGALQG